MHNDILWSAQGVEMPQLDYIQIQDWIEEVAKLHNRIVGELAYVFCSDDVILDVNVKFLGHDYYTDIITFDYTKGRRISGDMYISLETVATNAELVHSPYSQELLRVIIHGVLHLCGINDKGPGEREIMEANENEALSLLASKTSLDL